MGNKKPDKLLELEALSSWGEIDKGDIITIEGVYDDSIAQHFAFIDDNNDRVITFKRHYPNEDTNERPQS